MNNYKLVAPDIDSLLNCFERGFLNPSAPSEALCKAMDPLFEMLREMAPLRKNDEAKAIWVTIPRGSIEDFGSYEDMLECEELFPEKYGAIIDFIHVYGEEMEKFGDAIEWLPEEEAKLI